jgi:hypothetical protein
MSGIYCADSALQTAVSSALEFYGLDPSPAAVSRRPPPARTLGEQLRRIDTGRNVLALVRRQTPVGPADRLLIERLVDSACQRLEEAERPARVRPVAGASEAAVIAYAAAGGGLVGSFESFRKTFVSDAELLEPMVDRQDVRPAPLTTNPTRRPHPGNPPGSSSPAKTNPTRTIRSSRWTAGRKAVRS